jgi:Flp pilus assembly protein TadG
MRELARRSAHTRSEDGVTLVIVALVLVALFAMLVLVVDVGGLLLNRRQMVNASDSAALAAAKTCAIKTTQDTVAGGDPELAADTFARDNSATANIVGPQIIRLWPNPTCQSRDNGYVTVRYSSNQQLFFAGLLGAGATKPVTTQATAIWGPAGAANPLPLAIYTNSLASNCNVETLPTGTECYFWFDNNNFGSSRFGILDLRPWDGTSNSGWDVPPATQSCGQGVGASDLANWIQNAGISELDVNYPSATYVCIIEGTPEQQVWGALERREGEVLTFPINRCETSSPFVQQGGQVDRNGTEVPCTTAPHKYDIIGFVDFQLEQVLQSQQEWGGSRGSCTKNNYDVLHNHTYPLVGLGGNCPSSVPSGVRNLLIDGQPPGAGQYTVDNLAKPTMFTWTGPDKRINISYDWWIDGECGEPPTQSSAVCIKVKTVEVRVGGGGPGTGASPNIRAVKLCDPMIATSCDPYNVPPNP